MPGPYSKYNVNYFVNYANNPKLLTSVYSSDGDDASVIANLGRNITNKTASKQRGNAFYTLNLQADKQKTTLTGPYTTTQKFKNYNSNYYTVFKSGFLQQKLKQPLTNSNYNIRNIKYVDLQYEIVQSVIVQHVRSKRNLTFTNVGVSNTTDFTTLNTQYSLNFDNAILTSSVPY